MGWLQALSLLLFLRRLLLLPREQDSYKGFQTKNPEGCQSSTQDRFCTDPLSYNIHVDVVMPLKYIVRGEEHSMFYTFMCRSL